MKDNCLILDGNPEHTDRLSALCDAQGLFTYAPTSLHAARKLIDKLDFAVAFIDLDLPERAGLLALQESRLAATEILLMSGQGEPLKADEAIRLGASKFLGKPVGSDDLRSILIDLARDRGGRQKGWPEQLEFPGIEQRFGYLYGSSVPMRKLYQLLREVAPTEDDLLLVGESGTGKGLVARTVHEFSPRKKGVFIAFNCAAVDEAQIESELFGQVKSSSTGAANRRLGLFERAEGGTVLLDEITEMKPELQTRLLRVLDERRLRRPGSEEQVTLDVRVICAANVAPEQAMASGKLLAALYYRLAQFPVHLPALRERKRDICGLAQLFLDELNRHHATSLRFTEQVLALLAGHDWPGNVRQLKHTVERAYIMSDGNLIRAKALVDMHAPPGADASDNCLLRILPGSTLAESERQIIMATLQHNRGDKKRTAGELGISLKTLYNRLHDYSYMEPRARSG